MNIRFLSLWISLVSYIYKNCIFEKGKSEINHRSEEKDIWQRAAVAWKNFDNKEKISREQHSTLLFYVNIVIFQEISLLLIHVCCIRAILMQRLSILSLKNSCLK